MIENAPVGLVANCSGGLARWGKREVREIIYDIAWVIWFCRNKFVYAHKTINVHVVVASFLHMVADFDSYKQKVSFSFIRTCPSLTSTQWKKPPQGTFKINVDAQMMEGVYIGLGL